MIRRFRWRSVCAAVASQHAQARAASGIADRSQLLAALKQLQEQASTERYRATEERPRAPAPPAAAAPTRHSRPPSARHVQVQVFLHQMNELAAAGDTEGLAGAAQAFLATQRPWQRADQVVAASLSHATRRLLQVGGASRPRSLPPRSCCLGGNATRVRRS
jgi:hypothetical protein